MVKDLKEKVRDAINNAWNIIGVEKKNPTFGDAMDLAADFVMRDVIEKMNLSQYDAVRTWAANKGIFDKSNTDKQFIKLVEEVGELAQAQSKNRPIKEIQTEIGDCMVVLTILASLHRVKVEDCFQQAIDKITKRKGEMINGVFVKDAA